MCSENFFWTRPQGEKVYIFPCPKSAAERNGGTNAHESCPRMSPERAEPKKKKSVKMESDEERVLCMLLCFPKQNIGEIQQVLVTKIDALKNFASVKVDCK